MVDLTAPVVSLNRVADADNGLFDSGFAANDSATVTITVDGNVLTGTALTDAFSTATASGLTSYTAQAGQFTGSEVVV